MANNNEMNLIMNLKGDLEKSLTKVNDQIAQTDKQTQKASAGFAKQVSNFVKPSRDIIRAFRGVGMVAGVAFGAVVGAVLNASEKVKEIDRTASELGTTAEEVARKYYGITDSLDSVRTGINVVKNTGADLQRVFFKAGMGISNAFAQVNAQIGAWMTGWKVTRQQVLDEMNKKEVFDPSERMKADVELSQALKRIQQTSTQFELEQLRIRVDAWKKAGADKIKTEEYVSSATKDILLKQAVANNNMLVRLRESEGDKIGALRLKQSNEMIAFNKAYPDDTKQTAELRLKLQMAQAKEMERLEMELAEAVLAERANLAEASGRVQEATTLRNKIELDKRLRNAEGQAELQKALIDASAEKEVRRQQMLTIEILTEKQRRLEAEGKSLEAEQLERQIALQKRLMDTADNAELEKEVIARYSAEALKVEKNLTIQILKEKQKRLDAEGKVEQSRLLAQRIEALELELSGSDNIKLKQALLERHKAEDIARERDKSAEIKRLEAERLKITGDSLKAIQIEQEQAYLDYVLIWGENGEVVEQFRLAQEAQLQDARETALGIKGLMTDLSTGISGTFKTMFSDSFRGELKKAKDYFKDFALSVADAFSNMLAKMLAQSIITGNAMGQGQGWLGNLFGRITGAFFTRGATPSGTVGNTGMTQSQILGFNTAMYRHSGGIAYAHSGYLASDEVPLIAQVGEGVLSRRGMSRIGRANFDRLNRGDDNISTGGVNVTIAPVIQAWDTSDIYRNRKQISDIIAQDILQNGNIRRILKQAVA